MLAQRVFHKWRAFEWLACPGLLYSFAKKVANQRKLELISFLLVLFGDKTRHTLFHRIHNHSRFCVRHLRTTISISVLYTTRNAKLASTLLQACYLAVIKSISGCVHIACSGLMITSLLQVVNWLDASWLSRSIIHKVDEGCFKNWQQVCKFQVWFSQTWCNLVKKTRGLMKVDGQNPFIPKLQVVLITCRKSVNIELHLVSCSRTWGNLKKTTGLMKPDDILASNG